MTNERPPDYGDPAAEYRAAKEGCAVFDVSDRTQIELQGGDRAKFLHNFCTNDVKSLAVGQGCEAFITNVKGRVLAHVFIFAAPDSLWIETTPGAEEPLLEHLDRYLITEDVTLHGRTAELGELFLSGGMAADTLAKIGFNAAPLPLYAHAKIESLVYPCFVRRVDLLGSPGFLLSVERGNLATLRQALVDAGAKLAGSSAFEALRIEAGLPVFGRDITDDHIAQEVARTKRAISFKKGCYLGQETIARLYALGHTNREFRGLRLEGPDVPAIGATITAADDDKPIGTVTSAALSYADNRAVALAYLPTKYNKVGTSVRVQVGEHDSNASVFWPFA